jgi:hypothetical protein
MGSDSNGTAVTCRIKQAAHQLQIFCRKTLGPLCSFLVKQNQTATKILHVQNNPPQTRFYTDAFQAFKITKEMRIAVPTE